MTTASTTNAKPIACHSSTGSSSRTIARACRPTNRNASTLSMKTTTLQIEFVCRRSRAGCRYLRGATVIAVATTARIAEKSEPFGDEPRRERRDELEQDAAERARRACGMSHVDDAAEHDAEQRCRPASTSASSRQDDRRRRSASPMRTATPKIISATASLRRLSPFSTVAVVRGTDRRSIAAAAAASGGETIAPSATAAASGKPAKRDADPCDRRRRHDAPRRRRARTTRSSSA